MCFKNKLAGIECRSICKGLWGRQHERQSSMLLSFKFDVSRSCRPSEVGKGLVFCVALLRRTDVAFSVTLPQSICDEHAAITTERKEEHPASHSLPESLDLWTNHQYSDTMILTFCNFRYFHLWGGQYQVQKDWICSTSRWKHSKYGWVAIEVKIVT